MKSSRFRPKDIDAVVLSHAHIDHCGNLPNLVRQGFGGPIYCTIQQPGHLAAVMLGDAAKIQEEDAAYLNRKRAKGEPKIAPIYDSRDVFRTLVKLQAVSYDSPYTITKGLEVTFVDAGHLLGSAMISLRIDGPNGERRLTFTGDLGRPGLPILRDTSAGCRRAIFSLARALTAAIFMNRSRRRPDRLGEIVRRFLTAERRRQTAYPRLQRGPNSDRRVLFASTSPCAGQLPDTAHLRR